MMQQDSQQSLAILHALARMTQEVQSRCSQNNSLMARKYLQAFLREVHFDVKVTPTPQGIQLEEQHDYFNFVQDMAGTRVTQSQDVVKAFLKRLGRLPENRLAVVTGVDQPRLQQVYIWLVNRIDSQLRQNPVMASLGAQDDCSFLSFEIQKYLSAKLEKDVFPKEQSVLDQAFFITCRCFSWVTFGHLDVQ